MKQTWTFHVENFGKIKEASIEVRPFMIFAGENNSGKSYLMSLLWGLLHAGQELFVDIGPDTEELKQCVRWLEERIEQSEGRPFSFDNEGNRRFLDLINVALETSKDWLVSRIFNRRTTIGHISIGALTREPYRIEFNTSTSLSLTMVNTERAAIPIPQHFKELSLTRKIQLLFEICSGFVFGELSLSFGRGPSYLPASRTGFMMTYRTLVRDAIQRGYGGEFSEGNSKQSTTLNWPTNNFLQDLVSLDINLEANYDSIADFLEREVLEGTITRENTPVPIYRYQPIDGSDVLPFHATSSLVSELAPLVLFLRSDINLKALIVEEPEAHLHLKMQQKMAVALVRLVNAGLPVWITTHSDTMFQQLNNLIKLYNNRDRERLAQAYGYLEQDFLDSSKVKAYQFSSIGSHTEVVELPLTSSGYSIPTFSESIREQTMQTIKFMELEPDEEDDE
ncbi:AAA family ATPase [Tumebacillus permanentifrigoris]|uniref:AAA ATPase-like protein n=1 Tax=Tumebacillus permanentifrigoris TaxID=378543 RepID=A0A316DWC4_9BACL|nr:AAA family ATPase [Tumebacillus permanentifrigoris]PWK13864.1 AAA ATPase-like protein [Tumebacillus permanentifrigoris]